MLKKHSFLLKVAKGTIVREKNTDKPMSGFSKIVLRTTIFKINV